MERLTYTDKEMKEIPGLDCPVRQEDGSIVQNFCGEVCSDFGKNCPYMEMGKKLKEYEDLEEQGLLLKLPCKVGDEVWEANGFWKKILKRTVAAIVLSSGNHIYIRNGCGDSFEFGVDVFLTKAEAEKALAEMG